MCLFHSGVQLTLLRCYYIPTVEESLLNIVELLDVLWDPESVALHATDFEHPKNGGVEEWIANGQGQLDVSEVTRAEIHRLYTSCTHNVVPIGVGPHPGIVKATWQKKSIM